MVTVVMVEAATESGCVSGCLKEEDEVDFFGFLLLDFCVDMEWFNRG